MDITSNSPSIAQAYKGPSRLTRTNSNGSVINNLPNFQLRSRLHFIGSWRLSAEELLRQWMGGMATEALYPWMRTYFLLQDRILETDVKQAMRTTTSLFTALSLPITLQLPDEPLRKVLATDLSRGVFIHVDMDAFFCSVALSKPQNAALRSRPCAVASGGGESEISSCNYVARGFGVRAGSWIGEVRRTICPQLQIVQYDLPQCKAYSEHAYKLMFSLMPLINICTFVVCFGHDEVDKDRDDLNLWIPLTMVLEVISVDDTMLTLNWPAEVLEGVWALRRSNDLAQQDDSADTMQGPPLAQAAHLCTSNEGSPCTCMPTIRIKDGPMVLPPASGSLQAHLDAALFAVAATYASRVRKAIISECSGISASCGIGNSYLVSRLATQHAKPNGTAIVLPSPGSSQPPHKSLERLLGDSCELPTRDITDSHQPLEVSEHPFWVDNGAMQSLAVPYAPALQAEDRLIVSPQHTFIAQTLVKDLFGVGRRTLGRIISLYQKTHMEYSEKLATDKKGRSATANKYLGRSPAKKQQQMRLSFAAAVTQAEDDDDKEGDVLIATKRLRLERGISKVSSTTASEDDYAACCLVFGDQQRADWSYLPPYADPSTFTCEAFRFLSLKVLQETLGKKNGVLLYSFSRGLDLRGITGTGAPDVPPKGPSNTTSANPLGQRSGDETSNTVSLGADAGEWATESCRAYKDALRYLKATYFSREDTEVGSSTITTTMGYACRPQHLDDVKSIVRQLLEDAMRKVLARRFAPFACPAEGNGMTYTITANRFEAFQSFKLLFMCRHPDYQKEPTKYLGLGKCIERAFNIRVHADKSIDDLSLPIDKQVELLDGFDCVPILFYLGAHPLTKLDDSPAVGQKRPADGEDELEDEAEGRDDDEKSVEEEHWRRGNAPGPVAATALVIMANEHNRASVASLDRVMSLRQCPNALDPPLPPAQLGLAPVSVTSLRRWRVPMAPNAGDNGEDPFTYYYNPSTAPWIDSMTDAMVKAIEGAFQDGDPNTIPPKDEDDIPLHIKVEDVRGMALSIVGLQTTEQLTTKLLGQRSSSGAFLQRHPSDWLSRGRSLYQKYFSPNTTLTRKSSSGFSSNAATTPSLSRNPSSFSKKPSVEVPAAVAPSALPKVTIVSVDDDPTQAPQPRLVPAPAAPPAVVMPQLFVSPVLLIPTIREANSLSIDSFHLWLTKAHSDHHKSASGCGRDGLYGCYFTSAIVSEWARSGGPTTLKGMELLVRSLSWPSLTLEHVVVLQRWARLWLLFNGSHLRIFESM